MKTRFSLVLICLLLCAGTTHLAGQGNGITVPPPTNELPPSPAASQLLRFGNYPVSHFTGLVDISVPIHTVELNGITLPIGLRYHASGIKYDDVSTGVGLGWMLEAGGAVVYQVNGLSGLSNNYDNDARVFKKTAGEINITALGGTGDDFDELLDMVKIDDPQWKWNDYFYPYTDDPVTDSEFDILTYSIPGHTGKAGYRKDTGWVIFDDAPIVITTEAIANDPSTGQGTTLGGGFGITDENGVKYIFGAQEKGDLGPGNSDTRPDGLPYETTFVIYMTKIVSADGKTTVDFTYMDDGYYYTSKPVINDAKTVVSGWICRGLPNLNDVSITPSIALHSGSETRKYAPKLIRSIVWSTEGGPGGSATFNWTPHVSTPPEYDRTRAALNSIVITEGNVFQKNVLLERSSFGNGFHQRLDRVAFRNEVGTKEEYDYKFEYNKLDIIASGFIGYNRATIDHWGYYNGSMSIDKPMAYVPTFEADGTGQSGMNREPQADAMKWGMINKVTYPTGGSSVFEFEPHKDTQTNGTQRTWGGLRIKGISYYDADGRFLYKDSYEYVTQTAVSPSRPGDSADYLSSVRYRIYGVPERYASNPLYRLKLQTYGSFSRLVRTSHGSPVVYPKVREHRMGAAGEQTTTEYTYSYEKSNDIGQSGSPIPDRFVKSYDHLNGKLKSKTVKNRDGDIIYELENTYEVKNPREYHNLALEKTIDFENVEPVGGYLDNYWYTNIESYLAFVRSPATFGLTVDDLFEYYDYYHVAGRLVLTTTVETKDGVSVTTDYTYPEYPDKNNAFLGTAEGITGANGAAVNRVAPYPATARRKSSDGVDLYTEYKYPYDRLSTSQYNGLVSKNILTPVIEQTVWKGADKQLLLQQTKTNYPADSSFNGYLYAPSSVQVKGSASGILEERITYHNRNSYGRPLYVVQDGVKIVYVWDSTSGLPSVEVRGADYGQLGGASLTAGNVRGRLPANAQAITRTYSGGRVTSESDTSGKTTTYTYDEFNRLSTIEDNTGKVIEKYEYHYK